MEDLQQPITVAEVAAQQHGDNKGRCKFEKGIGRQMANPEHLSLIKQGVETWNSWRAKAWHELVRSKPEVIDSDRERYEAWRSIGDFSGAEMTEMQLQGADLRGAALSLVEFYGSNLAGADMRGADLFRANLTEAHLEHADLRGANLEKVKAVDCVFRGANLSSARLDDALLLGADFQESNLTEATLVEAELANADLRGATVCRSNLRGTNLFRTDFRNATLTDTDLAHARFVETRLERATLTHCRIYGVAAWGVRLEETAQTDLIITDKEDTEITVDDLATAQFVHLLLNHQHLRQVINSVTARGVLILGRFGGGGLDVLRRIAAKLRTMKYLPMIFDFNRPDARNYTETVKTLVGLSRFVIVDLSGPSVPQELYATVPHFKIPFVPILEMGRKPYAMLPDILEYEWVLKPVVEFSTPDELEQTLPSRIVVPAELKHAQRQRLLDELFARSQ
jgi:uncharacterized protein YjbI with pentapeptide repeats